MRGQQPAEAVPGRRGSGDGIKRRGKRPVLPKLRSKLAISPQRGYCLRAPKIEHRPCESLNRPWQNAMPDTHLDDRHALRQQRAHPLVDQLHSLLLKMKGRVLPRFAEGKAVSYTLPRWEKLTRFLQYPVVELSTDWAENSMRPMAIGRKNWLQIGSKQADPKIAAIFSMVESCRKLGVPIRQSLADVLPGLADRSIQSLAALTPAAYAANSAKQPGRRLPNQSTMLLAERLHLIGPLGLRV